MATNAHKLKKRDTDLAEDLSTLERSLKTLLQDQLCQRSEINTINLACGRADETGILTKIIGEKAKSGHIQGIDLRDLEIKQAQQIWKPTLAQAKSSVTCDFRAGAR